MSLLVQASVVIDPWLAAHPDYEDIAGAEVIEIRPRMARKANAVSWVKGLLGPACRLLVVGDDVTDEDMFAATSDDDAPVLVGGEPGRLTAARWRLESSEEVHAFYSWIISLRREGLPAAPRRRPSRVESLPDAKAAGVSFDLLDALQPSAGAAGRVVAPDTQAQRRWSGVRARAGADGSPRHLARLERSHATRGEPHGGGARHGGRARGRVGGLSRRVAPPLLQRPLQQRPLAPLSLVPGPAADIAPGLAQLRARERGVRCRSR